MSSINSVTTSASSTGLSGLVSGMDTEEMVTKMLTGAQNKVDTANADMQRLEWKQDMYRSVITKIQTFQDTYFNYTNDETNLLSNAFFNTMSTNSTSTAVTATASTSAADGTMTINSVTQLAKQYSVQSGSTASAELTGLFSSTALETLKANNTLSLSVNGGGSVNIYMTGTTQSEILAGINEQLQTAGLTDLTATVDSGKFTLTSSVETDTITVGASTGATALAILGLTAEQTGTGNIGGTFDQTKVTGLTVSLDGVQKTFSLDYSAASAADMASSLQTSINKAFGNGIQVKDDDADGYIDFVTTKIDYTDTDGDGNTTEEIVDTSRQVILSGNDSVMAVLGMTSGQSNKISTGMTVSDINFAAELEEDVDSYAFTINDVSFTVGADETLSALISRINSSTAGVNITYSSIEDKFSITSSNYGAGNEIVMSDDTGKLLTYLFGDSGTRDVTAGQNAVLEVNGVEVQRNNNSFTIDGVSLTLNETSDTAISIDISRNTDQIVDGITKFVDDYNSLIEELNTMLHEDTNYKDYAPLTKAQEDEMSDKEIELWNEKAQEGLLRGDSTISGFLSSLRSVLYSRVSDSIYGIYDLGINTSSDYSKYGQLVLEDKSALINAINTDPESVAKLFNDSENGIATKFKAVLDNTIKVSYSNPGSLIRLAGTESYTDNTINDQITDMQERLEKLQDFYDTQKERYWDEFNEMEKLISQMNQQSSWLTSQFS